MLKPKPTSAPLVIAVGVECDVGKERTENQDRVTRAATPYGEVFVVADGVGGYKGGSDAAQATVDGFVRYLNASGNLRLEDALQQAVRRISGDLQQRVGANPTLRGMGSTVVVCVIKGTQATYAHAGDSRAYLIRNRQVQQLTRDHSVMERLISQGVLTQEQAREHPDSSVLTRAIGQAPDVSLDIGELTLQPNDALLLCSDGLWAYAKQAEMEAVAISENLSASAVASALLNLALKGGGGDNISIQFLRFKAPERSRNNSLFGLPQSKMVPVIGLASVLAIVSGGLFILNRGHLVNDSSPNAIAEVSHPAAPVHSPEATAKRPSPSKPEVVSAKPSNKNNGTGKSNNASAPKPQEAAATGSAENPAPAKTPIIIIKRNGVAADWAQKLQNLQDVQASEQEGSNACLRLGRSKPVLLHSPKQAGKAQEIGKQISVSPSDIVQVSETALEPCGGDLVAMPANPSLLGFGKKAAEQTIGGVVDKAAKKAGEEVKEKATSPIQPN